MLQVDNFLIVFSLEVGGKFIGWFGLITNAIALPLSILALIAVSIDTDLSWLQEQLVRMEIECTKPIEEINMKQLREYLIVSLVLVIIMSTIYLIASIFLIRGTNNVNFQGF